MNWVISEFLSSILFNRTHNPLDYDRKILDYEFISPYGYGIGSENELGHWNVFIVHELDTDPITHVAFAAGEWLAVRIDAKTGSILETTEFSDMLKIHGRLK